MNAPIEKKVKAATIASGATSVVLWALATYLFHGQVPDVLAGFVALIVPAAVTAVAGYLAKHTPRPPTS